MLTEITFRREAAGPYLTYVIPMGKNVDTESDVYNKAWPAGYTEEFEEYRICGCRKYGKADIVNILKLFYNRRHTALEIGPGGGMWTKNCLIPNFKRVIALDVVPQKFQAKCRYIQAPSRNFTCYGIEDETIDFLFSFGVFCHLSAEAQATYLKHIFRKLRPGAKALVTFANFDRHPYFASATQHENECYERNINPEIPVWFYMNLTKAKRMVKDAGFTQFTDCIPDFRDTLALFVKPSFTRHNWAVGGFTLSRTPQGG